MTLVSSRDVGSHPILHRAEGGPKRTHRNRGTVSQPHGSKRFAWVVSPALTTMLMEPGGS